MSYTNGTTHYNLPQTTGSDKRDWSDSNQAFADVDAALYGVVQDTAQAELDIDALETRMDTAELNIATNTGDIAGLDTRVTTVEGAVTSLSGQVTDTRQDLEDMICAYNEASATSTHAYAIGDYFIYNDVLYRAIQAIAIGDTIVPDTNCTTTNITTELRGKVISQVVGDGVTTTFKFAATQLINAFESIYDQTKRYAILRRREGGTNDYTFPLAAVYISGSDTFSCTFSTIITEYTSLGDYLVRSTFIGKREMSGGASIDVGEVQINATQQTTTGNDLNSVMIPTTDIWLLVEYSNY